MNIKTRTDRDGEQYKPIAKTGLGVQLRRLCTRCKQRKTVGGGKTKPVFLCADCCAKGNR